MKNRNQYAKTIRRIEMAYNFTLMKRCRCDSCGHVDVFTKSRSFVTGVENRCPNCNHKLKNDVPLNEIEFKK